MKNFPVLDKGSVKLVSVFGAEVNIEHTIAELAAGTWVNQDYKPAMRLLNITKLGAKKRFLLEQLIQRNELQPFSIVGVRVKIKMPVYLARKWSKKFSNSNQVNINWSSNWKNDPEFYLPMVYNCPSENLSEGDLNILNTDISLHYEKSVNLYNKLVEGGVSRSQAELVLPQSLYVEFYNVIGFDDFIRLYSTYSHSDALLDSETIEYISAIDKIFNEFFPKLHKIATDFI